MGAEEIRKYVRIANSLQPDLTVLTGDYITWDPSTQRAVVEALAGLRAPFGVFACLGNHEAWSKVTDSITRLFEQAGIRTLRQARVPIVRGGAALNLIGVDTGIGWHMHADTKGAHYSFRPLEGVDDLVAPDAVNILLSHYPDNFDGAAALGIDLTLAGHTHGGQLALEFISPEIAPSRLLTKYVAGWFEKPGGQLYVNRGIGTIGVPMRVGARPEIAVFELGRLNG
jgi:predicted MPP superfamily phosphohydrolase